MNCNPKLCKKCPYYEDKCPKFVPFEINNSEVLFIGEAPGRDEVKEKKPFVGRSGKLLRDKLLDKYLGEGNYDVANIVCCRPPSNETPKTKARNICSAQFLNKIVHNYKYVVLLGETAFRHFFPKDEHNKKTKYSQYIHNFIEKDGIVFYPMYHPAYITRNEAKRFPEYKKMFLRWYNRYKDRYAERDYHVCSTIAELDEYFAKIKDVCAIDVETPDVYTNYISMRGGLKSVAIAYDKHKAFGFLLDHEEMYDVQFKAYAKEKLNELLQNMHTLKIFHNAKFDIRVFKDNGCTVEEKNVVDTMLMAYLHNDTEPSFGLKELTAKYLDGYNDIAPFAETGEQLVRYNCEDSDNTLQLYYYYKDKINWKLMNEIVMPALFFLLDLEMEGALVDKQHIESLFELTQKNMDKVVRKIEKLYPKEAKGVLWTSSEQVADFLYNRCKFPVLVETKGGKSGNKKPSTSKEALARLVVEKESYVAKLILEYRKNATLHNTFLKNSLLGKIQEDGRIHTQFNQAVTATGRLSSSKPNLQNMPRDNQVRNVFIAPDGYEILNADLSQIELRVVASIANEKTMIDAYKKGIDLHTYTAANIILNTTPDKVTKEARSRAKPVNFGFVYGQQAKKFIIYSLMSYGIIFSLKEAQEIRNKYFRRYSGLLNYYREVERKVRFYRYIESPFGRKRHFPPYIYKMSNEYEISEVFRKAVNAPVQGAASDIMMLIAARVRKMLHRLKLTNIIIPFLTVHDSVMYYVKKGHSEEAIEIINDATAYVESKLDWFKVPLVIDMAIGPRWGELEDI